MKVIEVENSHHMGDQFINFMFFTQIKDFIEKNNIFIKYYCWEQYHANLIDFCPTPNITILNFEQPYKKKYYELWQGGRTAKLVPQNMNHFAEDLLVYMFNLFLQDFNLDIKVHMWNYEQVKIKYWFANLSSIYKDIQVLIINSAPRSGQYKYDRIKWDNEIVMLSKQYKIATTEFVSNDILCLNKFTLKDITAISTNVDYIIGINTGPLLPLFNTYTLERVKKIYIFGGIFKHEKVVCNPSNLISCISP